MDGLNSITLSDTRLQIRQILARIHSGRSDEHHSHLSRTLIAFSRVVVPTAGKRRFSSQSVVGFGWSEVAMLPSNRGSLLRAFLAESSRGDPVQLETSSIPSKIFAGCRVHTGDGDRSQRHRLPADGGLLYRSATTNNCYPLRSRDSSPECWWESAPVTR